ncbi:MAG: DPP IV N-terminal domain-containing protein, partial [Pirellulaceae bacterium]|nr:DPP IV N-terminal domain-containing protein [Pirellulaceae bacterium]
MRNRCFRQRPVGITWFFTLVLHLLSSATTWGQGTVADYERARGLRATTANTVFQSAVKPHWFDQSTRFWYRTDLPMDHHSFFLVDVEAGTRRPAFDHAALGKAIAEATKKSVDAQALPLTRLEFTDKAKVVTFTAFDGRWRCDLNTYVLAKIEDDDSKPGKDNPPRDRSSGGRGRSRGRSKSPDEKWEIVVKDHNLVLRDLAANKESPLTCDGTENDGYESRIYWSPDSQKMVAMHTKAGDDRKVYLIESSPKDQLQPKLHSYDYLKPGDAIPQTTPRLFDIARRCEIAVDTSRFSNPWSIRQVRWQPDSRRLTFVYNQRGHQVLRIVAVDADTGEAAALVDEVSETFLDYANKQYSRFIDTTHELIWMSERDGWNHLYLIDSRTGDVKNQITQGHWIVRGVDHVDDQERKIWFRAGGIYPEQDPYYVHYCRINFDGTGLVILTNGNGTHSVDYSPDRKYVIDTYSRVDSPPVTELRRTSDGKLVCDLQRADASRLLATGWRLPERFVAKGRDGDTDIYGVIFRPTTFDAAKKYPVIEKIYAGPHGAFVPKRFSAYHSAQALAELGFIVVQIDGMGTSH